MKLSKNILEKMLEIAKEIALKNDCVNDSNFSVGTALLTSSGKIYIGHNIENYGIQSTCGERTAFSKALSEGEKEFIAILCLAYPKSDKKFVGAYPCGYCREFMSKFVGDEFLVYTIDDKENLIERTISQLVPKNKFNKNYTLKEDADFEKVILGEKINNLKLENKTQDEALIDIAKLTSITTNNYPDLEGAVIVGEKDGEQYFYTGSTQTDLSASIIRAPKVALLKALSEGAKNFSKMYIIKNKNGKYVEDWCSYDVLQILAQYANLDLEIYTIDENNNIIKEKIDSIIPDVFRF